MSGSTTVSRSEAERWGDAFAERLFAGRTGHGSTPGVVYMQMRRSAIADVARESYAAGQSCDEARMALAACRELIHGDGTSASIQRTIDLARKALGLPVS